MRNSLDKVFVIGGLIVFTSCNMSADRGKIQGKDSAKNVSTIASEAKMENLLKHFKLKNTFPFIIDSAYMNHIDTHDSLGTNEMKILNKVCFKDSVLNRDGSLKDFYLMDSLKANHLYKKWLDTIKDFALQPEHSNAYGLQRIILRDGTTLLVWALIESQSFVDPIYYYSNIYCTLVYNNTIGETFLLGYTSRGIDPPMAFETVLSSKVSADGKLIMEYSELDQDIDTTVAELNKSHYEYTIGNGTIALKVVEKDSLRHIAVKKED